MQKSICSVVVLGLSLFAAGCATTVEPNQRPPAFLQDYSLLKAVPSPEGTQIYSYKAPNVKSSDYHAAILDPVSLYQTATESGVTSEQIEKARRGIDNGIRQIVSKKVEITKKPGSGVLRIQVAITGATLEKDSLKPWNLVPVSAAIRLASVATGLDNKKPILVVELKVVDSQSGKLLKEVVSTIDGDKFRTGDTTDEFEKLATQWVQQALKYANKN